MIIIFFIFNVTGGTFKLIKAELYEQCNEVYKRLIPMYAAKSDLKMLSKSHLNLHEVFEKLINANATECRLLGTYYRVCFYGKSFGPDIDHKEFVYKMPKITRLSEVTQWITVKKQKQQQIIQSTTRIFGWGECRALRILICFSFVFGWGECRALRILIFFFFFFLDEGNVERWDFWFFSSSFLDEGNVERWECWFFFFFFGWGECRALRIFFIFFFLQWKIKKKITIGKIRSTTQQKDFCDSNQCSSQRRRYKGRCLLLSNHIPERTCRQQGELYHQKFKHT